MPMHARTKFIRIILLTRKEKISLLLNKIVDNTSYLIFAVKQVILVIFKVRLGSQRLINHEIYILFALNTNIHALSGEK